MGVKEGWCRISMHYIRTHLHVSTVLSCVSSGFGLPVGLELGPRLGGRKWASCNYFIRHSCRISTIFGQLDIIAEIFGGQGRVAGDWMMENGDGRNCSQRPPSQLDALHILQSDINHNYLLDLSPTHKHTPLSVWVGGFLGGSIRGGVGWLAAHSSEDVY